MQHPDTSDREQQRQFGLTMSGAIAALGFLRWGIHWFRAGEAPGLPIGFLAVAAAFLLVGLTVPSALRPLFAAWLKLAEGLNWVFTRVALTLAFFLLIVPTRVIISLFAEDPLKRAWDPAAESYWEEAEEQPEETDRYLNQF